MRGADAPEGLAPEVDRLLGQLASDDYAVREAARARLAALARDARSLLAARRDDPDPEVRRTVAGLLAALGEPEGPPVPTGSLGDLGLVTFAAEGTLADVLAAWEERVGGRVTVPPTSGATPVKVAVERVPYFRALDAVLAPAGLDVPDGFDEAGGAVAAPRPAGPAAPSAASGPFRLDVASVAVERSFRPKERREPTVRLRLSWSPAVHVTSLSTPKVVRAIDSAGAVLAGVPVQTIYGVGRARWAQPEVRLAAVEGALGERLETLDLRVDVRVRSGGQAVTFDDLRPATLPAVRTVAGGGGTATDTKVTLTTFGPDPDHPGFVVADLTAALARGVPADSVVVLLETSGEGARPLYDLSNRIAASDGTVRIRVRSPGVAAEGKGRALRVAWYTREEEIAVPFALAGVPLR